MSSRPPNSRKFYKKLNEKAGRSLRALYNFKLSGVVRKDVEDPSNFPSAKRLLTVVRTGTGTRQVWAMLREANESFNMSPPLATWDNPTLNKLHQFCSGRDPVLIHPSLYRAVKLTFPKYIGGLSHAERIKTEMGQDPMGPAIAVLSPGMFGSVTQHQED